MAQRPPITAFVSYRHESVEHGRQVLELTQRLRRQGIDAQIDQFFTSPPEGWQQWMLRRIEDSEFVVCVCTEGFHRSVSGGAPADVGLGVRWEGSILFQEVFDRADVCRKYVPVTVAEDGRRFIPTLLKKCSYYDVSADDGFENLLRHLTDQPRAVPEPVGEVPVLQTLQQRWSAVPVGRSSPKAELRAYLSEEVSGWLVDDYRLSPTGIEELTDHAIDTVNADSRDEYAAIAAAAEAGNEVRRALAEAVADKRIEPGRSRDHGKAITRGTVRQAIAKRTFCGLFPFC